MRREEEEEEEEELVRILVAMKRYQKNFRLAPMFSFS